MVCGGSDFACADQRTGIRTEAKPACLMSAKYSALSENPHAPSRGASSALPKFTPRPIDRHSANASPGGSAADAETQHARARNQIRTTDSRRSIIVHLGETMH